MHPMDYFGSNVFDESSFPAGASAEIGSDAEPASAHAEHVAGSSGDMSTDEFGGDLSTDEFGGLAGGAEPPLVTKSPDEYFGAEDSGALGDAEESGTFGDAEDFGALGGAETGDAAAPAGKRRRWPKGKSPEPDSLPVDEADARLLAEYGDVPASTLLAPAYSLRVFSRKRALGVRVRALAGAFDDTERERDEQLAAMVQKTRPLLEAHRKLRDHFGPVIQAEELVEERRRALQGANAEYDEKSKALGEQITKLEREIAAEQAIEAEKRAALAERQRLFDRAEATKKRLFIEIRSIVELAEKRGGALTHEQSARVQELEAKNAAFKPELEAAASALSAAQSALDSVTSGIARRRSQGRELERQRHALDEQFEKQIGARSEGLKAAEERRRTALADVGRAALALRGRAPLDDDLVDAIERADDKVYRAAAELERYARALGSYDAAVYKKGFVLSGAVLAVLALVIGIAVAAAGPDEPADRAPAAEERGDEPGGDEPAGDEPGGPGSP